MDFLNAMTVDVEDYFHVQAFAGVIARRDWKSYPSRVERNTFRLLEMFRREEGSSNVFCPRLGSSRVPRASSCDLQGRPSRRMPRIRASGDLRRQ